MDDQQDDRSLGQLFGDLSRQLGTLVSKEIQLAKTEITTRVTTVGRDAAMIGAGGALAYAALLMALIAVGLLLIQLGITPWLAFLLVAIIVGAIAAVLIMRGRDELQKTELAPTKTIETLKEDAEWAKEQVK